MAEDKKKVTKTKKGIEEARENNVKLVVEA